MTILRAAAAGLALLAAPMLAARPMPAADALHLARLLATAEQQARQPGDTRKLAVTMAALEASGLVPAAGEADPFPTWRARLPPAGRPAPLRGRTLGAAFRRGTLSPGGTLEFRQGFLAGQTAEVAVVAAGTGSVALEVVEDGGRTVCRSRNAARNALCRWVPDFSGASIVRLSGGDGAPTNFVLVLR